MIYTKRYVQELNKANVYDPVHLRCTMYLPIITFTFVLAIARSDLTYTKLHQVCSFKKYIYKCRLMLTAAVIVYKYMHELYLLAVDKVFHILCLY